MNQGGRPSVNTFAWWDISLLGEGFSLKLATNIHHVTINYWKGFQGQRSKVKVMTRRNAVMAEAWILKLTCWYVISKCIFFLFLTYVTATN